MSPEDWIIWMQLHITCCDGAKTEDKEMIGWRTEYGKKGSEKHAWMQKQIIQVAERILEAP